MIIDFSKTKSKKYSNILIAYICVDVICIFLCVCVLFVFVCVSECVRKGYAALVSYD